MTSITSSPAQRVFRVNKFKVPSSARDAFLEQALQIHRLLQTEPGLVQDFVLEQVEGSGAFNFITITIWEGAQAAEAARVAAGAKFKATGIDLKEIYGRLGVEADQSNYTEVDSV